MFFEKVLLLQTFPFFSSFIVFNNNLFGNVFQRPYTNYIFVYYWVNIKLFKKNALIKAYAKDKSKIIFICAINDLNRKCKHLISLSPGPSTSFWVGEPMITLVP